MLQERRLWNVRCFSSKSYPYVGPPPPEFNVCERPGCKTTAECDPGYACFPADTLGHPIGACEPALCKSDADCTRDSGGRCMPVEDPCWGTLTTLACVYPRGGCRKNSDCSSDEPPFTVGETFCENGDCIDVLQGTICE